MTSLVPAVLASASAASAVMGIQRLDRSGGVGRVVTVVLIGRTRWGRTLAAALDRAGVPVGPDTFVACVCLVAVAGGLAAWLVLRTPVVAISAAAAIVGTAWALITSADRRYLRRFAAQLPVVAQQLASAIGAGLSLRQAITRTAADAPEPAAAEFRRLATDLEFGARIDEALEATLARLPDQGLRAMVTAVLVQRVVGGNLGQALADLSQRLEERTALEREARSATAQARMSAWLVSGLPVAGGVLIEIAAPGTLARTLGRGLGLAIVAVAAGLQLIGVLLVRRIINDDGSANS